MNDRLRELSCGFALALLVSGGCSSGTGPQPEAESPVAIAPKDGRKLSVPQGTTFLERTLGGASGIVIDGDVSEWDPQSAVEADAGYLYLRFSVAREPVNIQAHAETIRIELDADANPLTGQASDDLGVDLAIAFSPLGDTGLGSGVQVLAYSPGGEESTLPHAMFDLVSAPTFAAPWFELRISRRIDGGGLLPEQGLLTSGLVRGRTALYDATGGFIGAAPIFARELPPATPVPMLSTQRPADKSDGAVRVMSMNVLRGRPNESPAAFVRLFRGLKPDVILFQEWSDATDEQIEAWFNDSGYFADQGDWSVVTSQAWGVAIASRFPIRQMGADSLRVRNDEDGNPIRYVGAIVETDAGPMAFASVHLKCCGSLGSTEDVRRAEEARSINTEFGSAAETEGVGVRVIAGDLNLVGGREPLDVLSSRLDADGSDMLVLSPRVLGDNAAYTWSDPRSRFSPGRLDYALVSDSTASVRNVSVIDTSRLAPEVLRAMRLGSGDTSESDHLPIVFDVLPNP